MADPIIAKAEPVTIERRSAPRTSVLLAAELEFGGMIVPARLLNLSSLGAMLDCQHPPASGSTVVLKRGALIFGATIAWADGKRVGVSFDEAVSELQIAAILRQSEADH